MSLLPRKMKDVSSVSFKLSLMSSRNFKIRFKVTNTKPLTYKSLSINSKKTSKSMVLKLLKLMLNIINVSSRSSLRIT